jgi:hypothetical protein
MSIESPINGKKNEMINAAFQFRPQSLREISIKCITAVTINLFIGVTNKRNLFENDSEMRSGEISRNSLIILIIRKLLSRVIEAFLSLPHARYITGRK